MGRPPQLTVSGSEQIPGLLERHQRRTVRLAWQIPQVARELYSRTAARLAGLLAAPAEGA